LKPRQPHRRPAPPHDLADGFVQVDDGSRFHEAKLLAIWLKAKLERARVTSTDGLSSLPVRMVGVQA
jgi:hypothetical protein